jgi:large subunit ribosomal protein L24
MQRLKTGDTVEVTAGKDKGVRGEIIRVEVKSGRVARVVVEGANVVKKHQKSTQAGRRQIQPGIIEFEAPINASNVMPICPSCEKRARVGFRYNDDGLKLRFCRKCDEDID